MEVILVQDVPNVGEKGDVLKVKAGFARNYLIPQKMAVTANPSNVKRIEEEKKQAANKRDKIKNEAQELADKLNETTVTIPAKTGTSGKIFGTITTLQITHALKDKGFDIDRRRVTIKDELNHLGTYNAKIWLHKEVEANVTVEVVAAS
jgi:large subunit ribosomal protein L9